MQQNSTYCVYLTVYKGNKLPPFYIGYTRTSKIIKGNYNGSVQSKKYKEIWNHERLHNPQLFKTFILKRFDNKKEAIQCESNYIRKLNVIHNDLYVNTGYFYNDHVYISGMKGKRHSIETREKISISRKRFFKTLRGQQLKNTLRTYIKSSEGVKHRQKLAAQRSRKIYQYTTDGAYIASFKSIKEAADCTGLHASNIGACCHHKVKTAGGFYWSFDKKINIQVPTNAWVKPVTQYSTDKIFIASFKSIKEAADCTGVSMSSISSCCSGRLKTAGGFYWEYQKSEIDS